MLNRDGVLLEVDGIPAQPNGFAAPQTVECRQHDRRFNQRPLYAGEKLVDFILVIESRLEAVLARAVYLIRWIHGKLVCLYRIFQRPMNEGMIVNHRVGLYPRQLCCVEILNVLGCQFRDGHACFAEPRNDGAFHHPVVRAVRRNRYRTLRDFQPAFQIIRKQFALLHCLRIFRRKVRMKSDFQVLLEQAKAEMENIRREEERQKAEKERRDLQAENKMQDRDRSGFLR